MVRYLSCTMAQECLGRRDCEKVAKSIGNNYRLLKYDLSPFCKEIRGYLGSHIRLNLEVENGAGKEQVSCFVKTIQGGNLTECFANANLFEKEVFIYKFLNEIKSAVPDVHADVIPKMYHHNTETQTVVLENLCEQGFRGNEELQFDEAHMLVILDTLAKFHSASFAYEERKSAALGRRYLLTDDYAEILEPLFSLDEKKNGNQFVWSAELGAATLVDLVLTDPDERTVVKNKVRKSAHFLIDSVNNTNFRKVLSHGDLWGFNCLFKYDEQMNPVESKLVDFQLNRYTPPAHDVNMVVYMASDRKTFKKNVHKYYKHYYERLRSELKRLSCDIATILPLEEFEASCKTYLKVAKYIWLMYRQTSQSTEENFAKVAKDLDTLLSVVLGDGRAWYVTQNFREDEVYRKALTEILEDYMHSVKSDLVSPEECYALIERRLGDVEYDFLGHDVVRGGDGKYELVVRIRRGEEEEEYRFLMDTLNGEVVACAKC